MFSSRTLAERNNDPYPYINDDGLGRVYRSEFPDYDQWEIEPRLSYQYGTIPANPILVRFRAQGGQGNVMWHDLDRDPTEDEKDHAQRVLALLTAVTS